ncbi:hypothetical protein CBS101457_001928 [Exobasidium rhododendri]|nr:hypothetical protein CBS101457_001928 [Exobasidium rhododendri]
MAAVNLPQVNIPIDYAEEKEKIKEFLRSAKGVVPALSTFSDHTVDIFASIRSSDDDAEEDTAEEVLDTLDGMDLDTSSSSVPSSSARATRRQRQNALKYMEQMQRIADRKQKGIVVELQDVAEFWNQQNRGEGNRLATAITSNAAHYVELISECIDSLLEGITPTIDISHHDDVLDHIRHQREERNARATQTQTMGDDIEVSEEDMEDTSRETLFPALLLRRYTLYLRPDGRQEEKTMAVRAIKSAHIGSLLTLRGIVTRVSEVKPCIQVDAYACDDCGAEVFQEIRGKVYLPSTVCTGPKCRVAKKKGSLHQVLRASKFTPFQEVKMQEMTNQVPVGHIPRTMTIHLAGPLTRSVNPGDVCDVSGIFLPTPYSGFKAIKAGLLTDTFLQAQHVRQLRKSYDALEHELTPEIAVKVEALKSDRALFTKLAKSIAPEIYGHEDVKKCLLLLLIGGVTKTIGDGMHIRGDINVCLMGDPGVAKSQLLKYISKIAPRGVYTTGRGSSGVGLTAAVMRDPATDEMVLEGGALVLADNGIACIDEFDKMDETDRTAIHEVMEQQTISISKAGISTTLNARTSILAAANPLYGRYNPKISPVDNINLPAALLSRFDILYLILDTPNEDSDQLLAEHVTYVHMHNKPPELDFTPIEPIVMKHYIAAARQHRPTVPKAASNYIVSAYVKLRNQSKEEEAKGQAFHYTSARTLLGLLRMSQALARLRFSAEVTIEDVDIALELLDVSKSSLINRSKLDRNGDGDQTFTSKIYYLLRDMAKDAGAVAREELDEQQQRAAKNKKARLRREEQESDDDDDDEQEDDDGINEDDEDDAFVDESLLQNDDGLGQLHLQDVRDRVIGAGFLEDHLQECLEEYQSLGIIQVTSNRIIFL